ncbi:GH25 family lysozyme [Burkholderia sp. Bp8963]|uniref:GH25 family lysozyme n=1 Tax=Burkholderia sp. Bp8963 TaxID=2184547 RepID=UPI00163ADEF5|nr:GH25 family lysozyme [Burkholderia sp. Bp8963]
MKFSQSVTCARLTMLWVIAILLTPVFAEGAVCAGSTTLQGVDVSSYQGTIDWNAVAASGRQFAYARVSDGATPDTMFDVNYTGIKAAGLARGAYQFFRPSVDPATQAALILQKVGPGDLPPALDVEVTDGQSPATIAANVRTWVTIVQNATGRPPVILTAPGFWNSAVGSPTFASDPLWVANFAVACPTLPIGWNSWAFWMYGNNGSVPGILGAVDVDEFNGSLADLNNLKGGHLGYVTNAGSNSVSVINTATNAVTATIRVGTTPLNIALTPNGQAAYVVNSGANTVSVINTATNTVTSTIPVGLFPTDVIVTPDGANVYVVNAGANSVSVINTAANTVVATVPVGANPVSLAASPDGAQIYVTNAASKSVSVINTATNTVTATVPAGSNPLHMVIH